MKDYYAVLGVSYSATALEIKRKYRSLAVKYHPDKNPDPKAQVLFQEINEAYDVLSDPQKKMFYDLKRQNPLGEVFREEVVPQPPRHRDPRYRRKAPANGGRRQQSESQRMRELMREYLPYVKWFSWASLVFSVLFFADYILPYQTKHEEIVELYVVRGTRNNYMYTMYVTDSGKKIKSLGLTGIGMGVHKKITYEQTIFYSTVMTIADESDKVTTAYVYGPIALFPGVLFIISVIGILFRKNTESYFNTSIVCGIFLLINLYLILG